MNWLQAKPDPEAEALSPGLSLCPPAFWWLFYRIIVTPLQIRQPLAALPLQYPHTLKIPEKIHQNKINVAVFWVKGDIGLSWVLHPKEGRLGKWIALIGLAWIESRPPGTENRYLLTDEPFWMLMVLKRKKMYSIMVIRAGSQWVVCRSLGAGTLSVVCMRSLVWKVLVISGCAGFAFWLAMQYFLCTPSNYFHQLLSQWGYIILDLNFAICNVNRLFL